MKKRYTKKQIMESIAYWKKQLKMMNEESTFGNAMMIDTISELIQTVKETKKFNKSTDDKYENRVWNGEFDDIEKNLKFIEKNLRLLGGKNQDIEAEKEVYVNLVPTFRDIIQSLLFIIRSKYGMNMSKLAGNVLDKASHKFYDRRNRGISTDKTIYNDDVLVK